MKVTNAAILMGLMFNVSVAFAGMQVNSNFSKSIPSDAHQIPNVNSNMAQFDNACANYAAAVVSGVSDPAIPEWKRNCAGHPDKATCRQTSQFVSDSRGSQAAIACVGSAASAEKAPASLALNQ
jgi:hypothetical protein